jgi:hypothetical protein
VHLHTPDAVPLTRVESGLTTPDGVDRYGRHLPVQRLERPSRYYV